MSRALEASFGRYAPDIHVASGVYGKETGDSEAVSTARRLIRAFTDRDGGPPRVLVAKVGQDGHDRGQKVIASAFADLGFDVSLGPLFQTPEEAAALAIEKDVHVLGISTLAAGHLTFVPAVKRALELGGRPDMMVVVGGVVPPEDYEALRDAGAAAIFPPGTSVVGAAATLIEELNRRLGYELPSGHNFPPA
jgi:methylmalonyl-CoA mutase